MGAEILERDDLSLYVVAGVPKSFRSKLQGFVEQESKAGGSYAVDAEFTEWVISRLRDEKRPRGKRSPASRALWRAYSALSAARYYLEDESEEEEKVRALRARVEELWRELSPMFAEDEEDED